LYERKLAIFDKAIQQNPGNSFRLKIERTKYKSSSFELINSYNALEQIEKDYLELLVEHSALSNMKREKDKQLQQLADLFEVWFEYLKFLSNTNSTSITFYKIKRTFHKCFEYFLTCSNNSNLLIKLHTNSELFLTGMLQLLDCYCSFLARMGYVEKVIGIYQAMIEFNFNSKSLDLKSKRPLFELFWDIGLPRFGEKLVILFE
jgi:hypothetical protein